MKINWIRLKRAVRSNRHTRKMADFIYVVFTGQYIEKKHIISKNGETCYIIRPPYSPNGLGGLYLYVLGHIQYARSKGYIPAVDFEHYKTVYSGEAVSGNRNIWEWYFKQPGGIPLKKALAGNYILARTAPRSRESVMVEFAKGNTDLLKQYCEVGGGICLNENMNCYIRQAEENLKLKKEKALGVFCRGSDYVQLKPCGHPVQPELNDLMDQAEECLTKWNCEKIFLLTEEKEALQRFNRRFPGKVISSHQNLVDNYTVDSGLLIEDFKTKQFGSRYISGMEYLAGIVLLASCDSFLGAMAGGSAAALVWNGGKYTHCKIINLGVY